MLRTGQYDHWQYLDCVFNRVQWSAAGHTHTNVDTMIGTCAGEALACSAKHMVQVGVRAVFVDDCQDSAYGLRNCRTLGYPEQVFHGPDVKGCADCIEDCVREALQAEVVDLSTS